MLRRQPIQLLQYFTTKFALYTQYPQCHYVELRKQLKQPLQQVTTLRQDIASSRPKVACRETTFTTLRLAYNQVEIIQYALKGQKFLAQGIALGNYERQPVALKGQKR